MTLTETIKKELMDAIDDPVEREAVFRQHTRSKGPLYNALADVIVDLYDSLAQIQKETAIAETRWKHAQEQANSKERHVQELDHTIEDKNRQIHQGEKRLAEAKGLLKKADTLERLGFGEAELARLADLLHHTAAAQGAHPEEGVAQFFQTVERYERVVSLELEGKQAKAKAAKAKTEAARWEAETKRREVHSKARIETIDVVERMLARGVKAEDLPQWEKVLARAGVSAGDMATILERYGSAEALTRAREKEVANLESKKSQLQEQVKTLNRERENASAAIRAVGEEAIRQVVLAGEQARPWVEAMGKAVQEHGQVRAEVARLQEYVNMARAIQSRTPESWQTLSRVEVRTLQLGVIHWSRGEGRNIEVAPPEAVFQGSLVPSYARLPLSQLGLWILSGLFTEEERKALRSDR